MAPEPLPLTQPHSPPSPRPRCVVLKLASLGIFSFSLGQTVLCIGRNKTSCAAYGYNACDYEVTGGSIKACPSCPSPVSPLLEGRTPPGAPFPAHCALPGAFPCSDLTLEAQVLT